MKRIAYLCADFGIPVFGNKGASIHVREFTSALQAAGHDVRIVAARLGDGSPEGFTVPVQQIRFGPSQAGIVRTMRTDSMMTEPMLKEVRSALFSIELVRSIQAELHRWQPDAIYERYSLMSTAGIDLARALDIPLILEVNAPLASEAETHRGLGLGHTVRETEQYIFQSADHIVTVSNRLRVWLIERGIDSDRISVTPNRVDVARFQAGERSVSNRPVVGFAGTLKPWHGTETLVRAIAALAHRRGAASTPNLLIVGDGPQRALLERVARENGIEELVQFTGLVDHADMPARICDMDIAVAPYEPQSDFYFSPLKLFEYMAAGRAIVASDIGQIPEIIDHGRNGLLAPPGDITAMAQSIARLLDDPALARTLGQQARADAVARYGWEHNVAIVTSLVDRLRVPAELAGQRV